MAKRAILKRPKFVSPWTYDRTKNVNSLTGGESVTVPNQAMSVREIMIRFTRGTPPLARQAVYNEEHEIPDVEAMDFAEREAYAAENAQRIKDLQSSLEAKREAQAAKARGPLGDSSQDVAPLGEASKRSEESADPARPANG